MIHDSIQTLINHYGDLGPLSGIFLPFLEAFLPFLPLTVFMLANAAAHGLVGGFILSYFGCVAGAWSVYWIFRYFGGRSFLKKYRECDQVKKYTAWLDDKGVVIVTLLCMVPVFPNCIITIVAGINKMSFGKFAVASAMGIFGLTFIFSFIGDDVWGIIANPTKLMVIAFLFGSFTLVSKFIERNYIVSN